MKIQFSIKSVLVATMLVVIATVAYTELKLWTLDILIILVVLIPTYFLFIKQVQE